MDFQTIDKKTFDHEGYTFTAYVDRIEPNDSSPLGATRWTLYCHETDFEGVRWTNAVTGRGQLILCSGPVELPFGKTYTLHLFGGKISVYVDMPTQIV